LRQLLEVAGVGNHGGELFEGFELVHGKTKEKSRQHWSNGHCQLFILGCAGVVAECMAESASPQW
jgi:hypothetical protein